MFFSFRCLLFSLLYHSRLHRIAEHLLDHVSVALPKETELLPSFVNSLNDSFAHVKRELAATEYRNEMMDFMWSAFRKVAGINNRKPNEEEKEKNKTDMAMLDSMNQQQDAPLAKFETDGL
jgi:hypothetical protein